MSIGPFRQAVQDRLQSELGIEFVAGKLNQAQGERDLGCCWPEGVVEIDGHILEATVQVRARVFLQYDRSEEPEHPIDPAPLEALVTQIQVAITEDQLTGLGGMWFGRVTAVDVDSDLNMVDARIIAWEDNAAT